MIFWGKYNTQTTVSFPMVKRGVVDLAVTADWTPAAADSAISKDQGSFADTSNTVAIVGGSPTRGPTGWKLVLTATELSCAQADVQIVDAATKAVEDQFLTIYTYGNASAKFAGDWSDIVRMGLTALPAVASGSAGAIPTTGTGANQISVSSGQVILQTGTGTGQLDFTSGVVKANLAQILGTALTETAGLLAGGFKKFFNIATPAATMDHLVLVDTVTTATTTTTATNLTNAPTNGDFTATMKTSIGTAVAASAVASVTAAVSVNSNVKKNAASAGFTFVMTDSTNHAPATGLTITATRSIDGAAFGACANAAAELSNGAYKIDLAAADVNGNHIMLRFTATAADDRFIEIITDP